MCTSSRISVPEAVNEPKRLLRGDPSPKTWSLSAGPNIVPSSVPPIPIEKMRENVIRRKYKEGKEAEVVVEEGRRKCNTKKRQC